MFEHAAMNVRSDDAATVPIANYRNEESNDIDVTAQLATKESQEQMVGMKAVYDEFRNRPIIIRAHFCSDADISLVVSDTTTTTNTNAASSNNSSSSGPLKVIKVIHFIRHGQGFHNLLADIAIESGMTWTQFESSISNSTTTNTHTASTTTPTTPKNNNPYMRPEVLDAPLTELGRKQAQQLHYEIVQNFTTPIDCVYVSPHCRTLQTGLIAFQHCINHPPTTSKATGTVKIPFMVAHELLREESGVHICDQRRDIAWQSIEFPQYDFHSHCPNDIDPLFHSQTRETKLQVAQRIYQFMEYLSTLEQHVDNIAVVSHSGWLHILFNAIVQDDCHPSLKKWFQTGEMRSVQVEFIMQ